MYGAQTKDTPTMIAMMFENDVEMYGAQTLFQLDKMVVLFENDVEMYGVQTDSIGTIEYIKDGFV